MTIRIQDSRRNRQQAAVSCFGSFHRWAAYRPRPHSTLALAGPIPGQIIPFITRELDTFRKRDATRPPAHVETRFRWRSELDWESCVPSTTEVHGERVFEEAGMLWPNGDFSCEFFVRRIRTVKVTSIYRLLS